MRAFITDFIHVAETAVYCWKEWRRKITREIFVSEGNHVIRLEKKSLFAERMNAEEQWDEERMSNRRKVRECWRQSHWKCSQIALTQELQMKVYSGNAWDFLSPVSMLLEYQLTEFFRKTTWNAWKFVQLELPPEVSSTHRWSNNGIELCKEFQPKLPEFCRNSEDAAAHSDERLNHRTALSSHPQRCSKPTIHSKNKISPKRWHHYFPLSLFRYTKDKKETEWDFLNENILIKACKGLKEFFLFHVNIIHETVRRRAEPAAVEERERKREILSARLHR